MGFRVDVETSLAFATDLPPSVRAIHPSGILHVRRRGPREEHVFVWIENDLHVEAAITHLGGEGFDVEPVFVPYSTRRNWIERYPHAAPGLECDGEGACAARGDAVLAAGVLDGDVCKNGDAEAGDEFDHETAELQGLLDGHRESAATTPEKKGAGRKRRRRAPRANMLKGSGSILPDAERDELHVEIYGYLSWLHEALEELERAELKRRVASMIPTEDEGGEGEEGGDGRKRAASREKKKRRRGCDKDGKTVGVDVAELKCVLEKLESAFAIIPNVKLEREAAAAAAGEEEAQKDREEKQDEKEGEDDPTRQQEEQQQQQRPPKGPPREPPDWGGGFLEGALSVSLARRVEARERAGKRRRSRQRLRPPRPPRPEGGPRTNRGNRSHSRVPVDFDVMFRRLEGYREVHGDCLVPKRYPEDQKLACFVKDVRYNRTKLKQRGLEHDEIPVRANAHRVSGKILTAERIARLDSIGFCWNLWEERHSRVPKVSWQGRFEEALEYREEHGRWPPQSMGTLGLWVQRQRWLYAKRDKNFMRDKVPKLDGVGFEWTPRGNTKISWDEGFERLMEYGIINGHYDVPCPSPTSELAEKQFYSWVESLHSMHRSYQLGRQHGSLTDERIKLLTEHGFQFRKTLSENGV